MRQSKSTNLKQTKKIAIVYDRVNKWGGAERMLVALNKVFPEADLYTSVLNTKTAQWANRFTNIYTTFLQKLPIDKRRHEILTPVMPIAFEQLNLSKYDYVISVTSEYAKGVITLPNTKHICICLTPTRYLWSARNEYINSSFRKAFFRPLLYYLQTYDYLAAQRPDKMIAISTEVQQRIKKYYLRDSEVIFPPIDLSEVKAIKLSIENKTDGYYLAVGRLVPYKKFDLVIQAFNKLGKRLVIVGTGSEERRLKKIANKNIQFAGFVDEKKLASYYSNARALIFPQHEDFGLVALEAMSFKTPVIAYKAGGALDTVQDGVNGVFFDKQTVESLTDAVKRFELLELDGNVIYKSIEKFRVENFENKILRSLTN